MGHPVLRDQGLEPQFPVQAAGKHASDFDKVVANVQSIIDTQPRRADNLDQLIREQVLAVMGLIPLDISDIIDDARELITLSKITKPKN